MQLMVASSMWCLFVCVCVFLYAVVAVAELLLSWGSLSVCGCIGNGAGTAGITALAAAIEAGHCQQLKQLDIGCELPNTADSRELIGTTVVWLCRQWLGRWLDLRRT